MTTSFAVPLSQIEDCFQGIVPATVATVSSDGVPNITELSIVHRIDDEHVALSRQFFNKTIRNLQANPRGEVMLVESVTARQFKLTIVYERTETEGSLFDAMSARLEAVASQCGMSKVFRLTAADICRVLECTTIPVDHEIPPPDRAPLDLAAVDGISKRIAGATTVDELVTESLEMLGYNFGYDHGFIMLADDSGEYMYTVASHGYEDSGAGSEVRVGEGMLGVAAERQMTVSVANVRNEMSYSRTVRTGYEGTDAACDIEQEIGLPGLPDVASQHIVPIVRQDQLLGVLCFESAEPGRFRHNDDFVFHLAAREIGMQLTLLRGSAPPRVGVTAEGRQDAAGPTAQVRYYAADDSVFVDNEYLIKGVAGRVLWRLLQSYVEESRVDFTNKEIRLDATLELPDIKDNLEARLALLRRRLEDRCEFIRISSGGRGRIHLDVQRELTLREA